MCICPPIVIVININFSTRHQGSRLAHILVLEIALVHEVSVGISVCVCACVCVCLPPRLYTNNYLHKLSLKQPIIQTLQLSSFFIWIWFAINIMARYDITRNYHILMVN